jgi:hypothetical protein
MPGSISGLHSREYFFFLEFKTNVMKYALVIYIILSFSQERNICPYTWTIRDGVFVSTVRFIPR